MQRRMYNVNAAPAKSSIKEGLEKYGRPYFWPVAVAVVFAAIGSIATLIGPNQLSKITDEITKGLRGSIDLDAVKATVLFLVIVYGVGSIMSYFQGFIMATVSQRFTQNLRTRISRQINDLPLNYFDTHDEGDTLSRVTNDLDTLAQSLNQSLGALVSSTVLLIGSLVMMFYTNWILALTAILSSVLGMSVTVFLLKNSQQFFADQQRELGNVSGYVEEMYTGHEVVKTYNNTQVVNDHFDELNHKLYSAVWRSQFLSGIMMPFMGFIGNLGYVMVSVVGAVLVLNDQITIGVVVAFMVYIRIFTQPLGQITQAFSGLQAAKATFGRVLDFLNEDPADGRENAGETLTRAIGEVNFEHVNFGYTPEKQIIKDFSATAEAGQKVAIVGPTGAGKTTLISLLMGFYPFQSGTIRIDGIDTKKLSVANLRDQFDMVLQDTWLFEDTIMANLKYNDERVSDAQAIEAAKAVGIDHFIRTLPEGYDTVLTDSVTLSVGQKQLMTIARALVRNRPILILDEATSSVDTRTEEQLQKAMDVLTKNKTSFVIAHRLSTIKNADKILVLNHGRIIESGSHDELMEQGGFYSKMYNSQFEKLTA